MSLEESRQPRASALGTVALLCGVVLLVMCLIEGQTGLPGMPRFWYRNALLWWMVALGLLGGGIWLLMPVIAETVRWRPIRNGVRFREITLYTRSTCPLCDEALDVLQAHQRWLGRITPIDIDTDSRLVEKFGTCVPVVSCDGKIRFRGKIAPALLRRLINGTPIE